MSVIIENTILCKTKCLANIKHKLQDYVGNSLVEHYNDGEFALISFDTRGDCDYYGPEPLLSSDEYDIKEIGTEDQEISTLQDGQEIGTRLAYLIKKKLILPKLKSKERKDLLKCIKYWWE